MIQFQCTHCSQPMQAAEEHQGKQTRCPHCQSIVTIPAPAQGIMPSTPAPPVPGGAPPIGFTAEDQVPLPPQITGCPQCRTPMQSDAVLCVECGYNRQTGQRLTTKVKRKKIDKMLEPSPVLQTRLIVWAVLALVPSIVLMVMVGTQASAESLLGFGVMWFLWALLWGLAWGTFTRAWIHRDAKKEVVIEKDQWVCFFPVPFLRRNIYPADYEYIYTNFRRGLSDAHQAFFLILVLLLFCMGACPGLIFWWYVFNKETCTVELSTGFGGDSVGIYEGTQDGMNECVEELQEVAEHLRVERK